MLRRSSLRAALLRRTHAAFAPSTNREIDSVLANPQLFPFTPEQVTFYRRNGYLLVKNVYKREVLDLYDSDVRRAAKIRGDSLLPNADECQNSVDIHVRSKEARQIADLEKAGKPVPQELRDRQKAASKPIYGTQKMHMKIRNKRAFLRGYAQAVKKRRRLAAARGYHVMEHQLEAQMKQQVEAEKAEKKRLREAGGGSAASNSEAKPAAQEAPKPNPDAKVGFDERTNEYLTESQVHERAGVYVQSEEFRQSVDRKMHISEVNRFYSQMGQAWVHLWHGDDRLRRQVTGPVGGALARASCYLGGFTKARLFTDQATLKRKWNNAHPVHCMAPFVDFIDMRAVTATLMLPPTPLDHRRGAFVLLPGSHEILRRISDDGRDITLFKSMPASWDVGEWVRAIPELRKIEPVELLVEPNDVLFTHTHMGFSHLPNFSTDEPLTHTLFFMPDGVVYTGVKSTWMSQSRDGPLRHYETGQPLRDEMVFPLLYNVIEAEMV
jgi:hypothetical protein